MIPVYLAAAYALKGTIWLAAGLMWAEDMGGDFKEKKYGMWLLDLAIATYCLKNAIEYLS